MAVGGLLALFDDITTVLDDIAVLSKVAVQKTVSISGDDLAVNSLTVHGVDPKRELPIVWSVAKGSLRNKAILIPSALALNLIAPAAITPILMVGGAYLCYEGVEKILHKARGSKEKKHHEALTAAAAKSAEDLQSFERKKIKGAIKTDLILSAEIIAITLGTVAAAPFMTQLAVLSAIGAAMTFGIYGLVGAIVKLDDVGLHLTKIGAKNPVAKGLRVLGRGLVNTAPRIMQGLTVAGTAAMLLVGGGLILHGIPGGEHAIEAFMHTIAATGVGQSLIGMAIEVGAGIAAGLAAIPVVKALPSLMKAAAPVIKKVTAAIESGKKFYASLFKKKSPDANTPPTKIIPPPKPPVAIKNASIKPALNEATRKPVAKPDPTPASREQPHPPKP
jgi:predicted DNA repair protein MutK